MGLVRRAPWCAVPLGIFVATRLFDALVVVLLARHQIPVSTLSHGGPVATTIDPPSYFNAIQSWDGQWYRQIVEHGYPGTLPTSHGHVTQNAWAFYPGFPALVWLLTSVGLPFGVAASAVSLVSGALAMCVLHRLVLLRASAWTAAMTVLAVNCTPMAPVLQVAYTEGLALLLLLCALLCLERRQYALAAVVGVLLALTRPVTAPLALVAGVELVVRWRRRDRDAFSRREAWTLLGTTGCLIGSVFVFPLVAGLVTGDLSAYSKTQQAWRRVAGNRPDTWLTSLFHGAHPARWAFVVLVVVVGLVIALKNRRWASSTRAWVATYPVYVLAATPPTSSIFRYLLLLGPGWWPHPRSDEISRERRGLVVVAVVMLGLASQVLWLYWYFVVTPGSRGTP